MNELFSLASELDLLLPITALLPLTAVLLVCQSNPYQTLVLRGILGSVSTLVYALLGAPDVALTEALVGTLLSTTLYAIALRSSMALQLEDRRTTDSPPEPDEVQQQLARWIAPLHLRLRLSRSEQAMHGWLDDGQLLVLRRRILVRRLQQCEGFAHWQRLGGQIHCLDEDARP
jgi:putative multicomponent Na+:H+ antiporter subunit B